MSTICEINAQIISKREAISDTEDYLLQLKETYSFDYDSHINEFNLIEADIRLLKNELKILESELNDLRCALYTNKVYEPQRLCDKVWNRRSNR